MTRRTTNRNFILLIFLTLWIVLPVMAQADTEDVLTLPAYINNVTINDDLTIDVVGELGDACTELGEISQEIEDETIIISIWTTRPVDEICAMQLETFETTIEIDTSGLAGGDYQLTVNGQEYEITIPIGEETEATAEAESTPEADEKTCDELEPEDGQEKFDSDEFCFLYPDTYAAIGNSTLVLLSGTELFGSRTVTLVVRISPMDEIESLDDLRDSVIEKYPDDEIDFEDATLNTVDALVTDSIVARSVGTRNLFTLFDEQQIRITVDPVDAEYEDAAEAVETLWDTVTESWIFKSDS